MPFSSSYISQQIHSQNSMFSGQAAYAQQLSYPMQQAMYPGAPMQPPPPMAPPPMTATQGFQQAQGGMYGEQMAMRMAGVGRSAWGVGTAAGGLGMAALGLDPLSLGLAAGMGGGGLLGGLAVGGAAALPLYAGGKVAEHYGGQFMGGMQDQGALNATLRNNFQHFGGRGRMGRGFSQSQMGQIGSVIQQELNTNVFANAGEMNQLIAGGAEAGMFTGVRDVQQFTQKFRKMLDTLKTVQDELGGSLSDALSFVRQSRQAGIFQQVDRVNFAGQMRGAEAMTGMSRNQLMGLATQGAGISRAVGGYGRQGAYGALRAASTLGAGIQAGAINEELLSEATGGRTGADAVQAFTNRMMQRSAAFSRRGMGRFSMFALSNAEGTGMDQEMMSRFMAGDLTTGQVSRMAHRNVGRMGRARAINQEGVLRGSMLEQGGLAGQIGMMRLMVGDRVLDQGDDLTQLVLQRRFRMNRPEAELMTSLMRNQSTIAQEQAFTSQAAERQQMLQTDLRENRSVDAFTRRLSHDVQQATGTLQTRELGRKFVTRISDMAERVMNDVLGVQENRLTAGDEASLNRLSMGRASAGDLERLNLSALRGGSSSITGANLFNRGLLSGTSPGEILQRRGVRGVRGLDSGQVQAEVQAATMARSGELILDRDRQALERLEEDPDRTLARIQRAQLIASGQEGGMGNFYSYLGEGGNANAADAFLAQRGMAQFGDTLGAGSLMRRGGGRISRGMARRDLVRLTNPLYALGEMAYQRATGQETGLESLRAVRTGEDVATSYFAGGGDLAAELRGGGATSRTLAERNQWTNALVRGALGGARGTPVGAAVDAATRAAPRGSWIQRMLRPELRGAGSDENRMLEAIEGVDSDAMRAVLGSEGVRTRIGRVLGAEGNEEQMRAEIANFRRFAGREFTDEGQAQAALSLIQQIESGMGEGGRFKSERMRRMLQFGSVDKERLQQLRDRLTETGGQYSNLGRAMGGELGGRFRAIGSQFMQFQDPREDINALRFDLARMDPESDEYREAVREMGGSSFGRTFLAGVAADRQRDRALSGRRGRRQRAETALGMITGGTLAEMDITVGGRSLGRRNRAGRIEAMFRRGGEQADEVAQQMQEQLEEAGVSGAAGLISNYRRAISDDTLDPDERRQMIESVSSNEDLRRVQREAIERRQRQQNPLDTTRNDLLTEIRNGINRMNENSGESVSTGAAE